MLINKSNVTKDLNNIISSVNTDDNLDDHNLEFMMSRINFFYHQLRNDKKINNLCHVAKEAILSKTTASNINLDELMKYYKICPKLIEVFKDFNPDDDEAEFDTRNLSDETWNEIENIPNVYDKYFSNIHNLKRLVQKFGIEGTWQLQFFMNDVVARICRLTTQSLKKKGQSIMTKTQEILNKVAEGHNLDELEINELTDTGVFIRVNGEGCYQSNTPYNKDFVNKMHQIKDSYFDHVGYTWNVPFEAKDELTKAAAEVFGTALSKSSVKIITVELNNKFGGEAAKKSSIKFHGKPLLFADKESNHASVNEHTTVAVSDLNDTTKSVSDHNTTYLVAEKGVKIRFMAYKHECDVKKLTESDELWDVLQVQEVKPLTAEDKKDRKLKQLEELVEERNAASRKLERLNFKLKNEFGVGIAYESVKRLKRSDARRDFLKKYEAMEEAEQYEKQCKEQKQRELEQRAEAKAKKLREQREHEALHTFYFTTDDIESATKRAVRIHLGDDKSFWFPKSLTRERFVYFKAIIPDDFDLTDTDDEEIELEELHKVLGDESQARKHGEDNNLNCDLNVRHRPKHIEPKKGVKADDSLKR